MRLLSIRRKEIGDSRAKASEEQFITFYNSRRPHQKFAGKTPDIIYFASLPQEKFLNDDS